MAKTTFDFDSEAAPEAELTWMINTLASLRRRRFPPVKPVPVPEIPPALIDEPWQSLAHWSTANNGDAGQTLVPGGVELWINNARSIAHGTGSRLFYLNPPSKQWVTLPDGVHEIRYPLSIPELFTVDQGADKFASMGIQCKDITDSNALWATNVQTLDGKLVAWLWHREAGVFHADDFPAYTIGAPNDCLIRLNNVADNTGWLEFSINGSAPIRASNVRTRGANVDNGWGPILYSNALDAARVTLGRLTVS